MMDFPRPGPGQNGARQPATGRNAKFKTKSAAVLGLWAMLFSMAWLVPLAQASTCPVVYNNNVCPTGIAEDAPWYAVSTSCSSRGTCIRGACQCFPSWAGENCSRKEQRLILGTMAITQTAFDEAPTRYLDYFVRVFENIRSQNLEIPPFTETDCLNFIIQTQLVPNWDISLELDRNSINVDIIHTGFKIAARFDVGLPNIPIDAYVSTNPGVATCCVGPNTPLFAETPTCTEACTASLGEHASLAFSAAVTAEIHPFINPVTKRVEVDVQNVVVNLSPTDLNFELDCGLTPYPLLLFQLLNNYVQPFGVLLQDRLSQALADEAERAAEELSAETSMALNVTNSTIVLASVAAISFEANSHATFWIEGLVRKSRFYRHQAECPLVYTTFVDVDSDALLPVPSDFAFFQETAKSPPILLNTLVEARLSRSALRAAMWASLLDETELQKTLTGYTRKFTMLDARFEGSINWELPKFEFPFRDASNGTMPVRNTVRFTVEGGESYLMCNNTGSDQLRTNFARFSFDVTPIAVGNFTNLDPNQPEFRLTGHLTRYDVSGINMNLTAPQSLSVPNALMKVLADEWMRTKIYTANDLLRERAVSVPPTLVRYVPGPRLEAVHDYVNDGSDGGNGYLIFSTRCACIGGSESFTTVETMNFGVEILPRCLTPCTNNGRRLVSNDLLQISNYDSDMAQSISRRKERTLAVSSALAQFAQKCGSSPTNEAEFRDAVRVTLRCASLSIVDPGSVYDCMQKSAFYGATENSTDPSLQGDLCDPQSSLQRLYGECTIPMSIAIPALFNDRPCVEGNQFSCSDPLRNILQSNCRCHRASGSSGLDIGLRASCDDRFLSGLLTISGVVVPWIVDIILWIVFSRCIWDGETRKDFRTMLRFRVERRARDSWVINVALVSSVVFFLTIIAWVIQDPFRLFARSIVQSDLFRLAENLETTFERFMMIWSNIVLFFVSMAASNLFLFATVSMYLGRCIWLIPLDRYIVDGQWVQPPENIRNAGKKLRSFSINVIRFLIIIVVGVIALPPLFFSFRFSVRQGTLQFPTAYEDPAFDLAANLTSVSTSPEFTQALVDVVGFALMSSVVGFISSGVIYIYHGAMPACFAAAQFMVYLMDSKEARDREEYNKYKTLLPPPDNSNLDRWRRIVFLFVWCAHATGSLGSSIAAILLYQTLRASGSYALCWLLAWVMPLPLVAMATSRKYRKRHFLITVLFILDFAFFTTLMIFLAPEGAAFTNWLAVILIISIFLCFFLILVSEFLTVADSIDSGRLLRERIDAVVRAEILTPQTKRAQVIAYKPTPESLTLAAGNPMFMEDRTRTRTADTDRNMSDWDRMLAMTQPTATAPVRLRQAEAMAEAAQHLHRRIRASMVLDSPITPPIDSRLAQQPQRRPAQLTEAQLRERERMRRRITQRLALRGVTGEAAQELTRHIEQFHAMKAPAEPPKRPKPPRPDDRQNGGVSNLRSPPLARAGSAGSVQSNVPSHRHHHQERPNGKPSGSQMKKLAGSKSNLEVGDSRPFARLQATQQTNNYALDDAFAAQFDPSREPVILTGPGFDDSFMGFVREVGQQIRDSALLPAWKFMRSIVSGERRSRARVEESFSGQSSDASLSPIIPPQRSPQGPQRPANREATIHHQRFVANQGLSTSYALSRARSRVARIFSIHVRPLLSSALDVIRERKENDDPATYGLRVPGRRMLFIQGLLLLFVLLVYMSYNRHSVDRLKDQMVSLALTATSVRIEYNLHSAYEWPGLQNVTEAFDIPLGEYVKRAREAYSLMWLIFSLWLMSLVVEIMYATFGRDMQEKRKGIKLARAISFVNLPLLLLAVVLPCAPDYVGISLEGVRKILPACAPKLTDTLLDISSNLFGVFAGVYLVFQTMIVLLLIVPSVSRALLFVVAREIIDLRKLTVFEPRKQYTITKKRLQNARFVWRTFPFMSPILTYLPLMLLCQLTGKFYVGVLTSIFMVFPVISAQFYIKRKPEDQTVSDWFIFSTVWIGLYISFTALIVLIESLERDQISLLLRLTLQSWTWYVKIGAEVCLSIVVASDILYQFMASDDELEADSLINDYFNALEEQAEHIAFMQQVRMGAPRSPVM